MREAGSHSPHKGYVTGIQLPTRRLLWGPEVVVAEMETLSPASTMTPGAPFV